MKKFRNIRNKKKRIPSKYLLAILSTVCVLALFISLVFNINGGPLNMVAGYVFVPMQKGINGAGAWLSGKANDFKTLGEVLEENKALQEQVDELTSQLNNTKLDQYELDIEDEHEFTSGVLILNEASSELPLNDLIWLKKSSSDLSTALEAS